MDQEISTAARDARRGQGGLGGFPRWLFYFFLVLAGVPVLWAFSVPGLDAPWLVAGLMLWAVAGLVWLRRLVSPMASKRGWSWWFVAAPVTVFVLVGLIAASVPLKARWAFSRASFDAAVAALPAQTNSIGAPAQIGSYTITAVGRVSTAVIFSEAHGGFRDAGFAYLPDGPTPDLLEDPRWTSLGDDWYSWTASF